ncbi:MAG: DUF1800 domain-containing protein [Pleurocapsa sp.]
MKRKLQYSILICISCVLLWLGYSYRLPASSNHETNQISHLINRMSFGVTPGQIGQVKSTGIEAYIQAQLNPKAIAESPKLENYLNSLDLVNTNSMELFKKFNDNQQQQKKTEISFEQVEKLKQANREFRAENQEQVVNANVARAINSNRQLQEVMVNFWFNHFNVDFQKKVVDFWVANYENDLRTHALGNFRDLLGVTAKHPAMLIYLDNELNTAPNSPGVRGPYQGLNENYARELLELHTLGVEGGYTQADIIALARIFTGWSRHFGNGKGDNNGFIFVKNRHDFDDKVFLGKTIKGSGLKEGEKALDILANHPATADHISYKLAQYFVADQPPSSLVDTLAQKFLESNGNIKTVLNTLFHSQEFNDSQYYQQKFKTPYQYVISMVRAGGIKNPNFNRIRNMFNQLSMPVYRCPSPDGYKNTKNAWLNPDAILRRVSFATQIANGYLNKKQPLDVKQLRATIGNNFSPKTRQIIAESHPRLKAALMLGSPEMMYR